MYKKIDDHGTDKIISDASVLLQELRGRELARDIPVRVSFLTEQPDSLLANALKLGLKRRAFGDEVQLGPWNDNAARTRGTVGGEELVICLEPRTPE